MSDRHDLATGLCREYHPNFGERCVLDAEPKGHLHEACGFRWKSEPTEESPDEADALAVEESYVRRGEVRIPKVGEEILVKAATSSFRLRMAVTRLGKEDIVCGSGLGTRVVKLSEHGTWWWWPPA